MTDAKAWAALIVALILGIVGVSFGIAALAKHPAKVHLAPVTSATAAVAKETRALKAEIATLREELATVKVASAKTAGSVHTIGVCLPELSSELNGLTIETGTWTVGERTLLTDAYLHNGKQISTYCTSTLEGRQ